MWLVPPSGQAQRLDDIAVAAGIHSIVALDRSKGVVVIDRASGMRSPVASELHRVSLAPRSEILLLQGGRHGSARALSDVWIAVPRAGLGGAADGDTCDRHRGHVCVFPATVRWLTAHGLR